MTPLSAATEITFAFPFLPVVQHDCAPIFTCPEKPVTLRRRGEWVQAFWTQDLVHFESAVAIPNYQTYNVEAAKVPQSPAGMSPHKYVMILEPFGFMINNAQDGNITRGWVHANATAPKGAPAGGPSMRFSDGYYYVITGGKTVNLYRSPDLRTWVASPHNPMIHPTPADAKVRNPTGVDCTATLLLLHRPLFTADQVCPGQ